ADALWIQGGAAAGAKFSDVAVFPGVVATLSGLTLTGATSHDGAGIFIYPGASATFEGCTIAGNVSDLGGGVSNYGVLTLLHCTVANNSAPQEGGGFFNTFGASATLVGCTITDNSSVAGGGIFNAGTLSITDCTITRNTASYAG